MFSMLLISWFTLFWSHACWTHGQRLFLSRKGFSMRNIVELITPISPNDHKSRCSPTQNSSHNFRSLKLKAKAILQIISFCACLLEQMSSNPRKLDLRVNKWQKGTKNKQYLVLTTGAQLQLEHHHLKTNHVLQTSFSVLLSPLPLNSFLFCAGEAGRLQQIPLTAFTVMQRSNTMWNIFNENISSTQLFLLTQHWDSNFKKTFHRPTKSYGTSLVFTVRLFTADKKPISQWQNSWSHAASEIALFRGLPPVISTDKNTDQCRHAPWHTTLAYDVCNGSHIGISGKKSSERKQDSRSVSNFGIGVLFIFHKIVKFSSCLKKVSLRMDWWFHPRADAFAVGEKITSERTL